MHSLHFQLYFRQTGCLRGAPDTSKQGVMGNAADKEIGVELPVGFHQKFTEILLSRGFLLCLGSLSIQGTDCTGQFRKVANVCGSCRLKFFHLSRQVRGQA